VPERAGPAAASTVQTRLGCLWRSLTAQSLHARSARSPAATACVRACGSGVNSQQAVATHTACPSRAVHTHSEWDARRGARSRMPHSPQTRRQQTQPQHDTGRAARSCTAPLWSAAPCGHQRLAAQHSTHRAPSSAVRVTVGHAATWRARSDGRGTSQNTHIQQLQLAESGLTLLGRTSKPLAQQSCPPTCSLHSVKPPKICSACRIPPSSDAADQR
jgi:hypothetical protein